MACGLFNPQLDTGDPRWPLAQHRDGGGSLTGLILEPLWNPGPCAHLQMGWQPLSAPGYPPLVILARMQEAHKLKRQRGCSTGMAWPSLARHMLEADGTSSSVAGGVTATARWR